MRKVNVRLNLILVLLMVCGSASATAAQDTSMAQITDDLKLQLIETEAKQAELQARVRQLDEDLKSENIERALAGIGSTKPEELRESRRRQLTIERDGTTAQLRIVQANRERLESAIRTMETQAYQSAAGPTAPTTQAASTSGMSGYRLLLGSVVGFAALIVIVLLVALARKAIV